MNIADRDYFQRVMETRGFQASGYLIGRHVQSGSIVFAHPRLSSEGEVGAVVLAAYRPVVIAQTLGNSH